MYESEEMLDHSLDLSILSDSFMAMDARFGRWCDPLKQSLGLMRPSGRNPACCRAATNGSAPATELDCHTPMCPKTDRPVATLRESAQSVYCLLTRSDASRGTPVAVDIAGVKFLDPAPDSVAWRLLNH
jgi:hypothetical protein